MAEEVISPDNETRAEVRANIQTKQDRAEAAAVWRHRRQVAGLLSGASLAAAGLYAGGAAISLSYPSTGNSPVNAVPPTHVLTLAGHQQGASARVNWELAKANGNYGYKTQLIVAANAKKTLFVNAEAGRKELDKIRPAIESYLQIDNTFTPAAIAFSTRATPDQILAGERLIAQYLAQQGTSAKPAPKTSLPSLKEGPIPPRDTSLSEDFAKKVRDGKITLNGSELDQRLDQLEAMRTIDEDEVKEIRHQWELATTSAADVKTAFTAANDAKPAELLTFAAKTKGILSATPEQRSWLDLEDRNKKETRDAADVNNTLKMMIR